jgi:membrane protein involved in colicin uptake
MFPIPGGYLTIGLGLALAASMLGNVAAVDAYLHARDDKTTALADLRQVKSAAQACSEATNRLKADADAREEAAKRARDEALGVARLAQENASKLMSKPPAVPGNDCASAKVQINDWLGKRRAK